MILDMGFASLLPSESPNMRGLCFVTLFMHRSTPFLFSLGIFRLRSPPSDSFSMQPAEGFLSSRESATIMWRKTEIAYPVALNFEKNSKR